MARKSNRPKTMAGKLYQGRYKGLSSAVWAQFGVYVAGGDTYENPAFTGKAGKSTTRNASLPMMEGACLAALGGILETTHGPGWVSVLYDTLKQSSCTSWAAHAANAAQPGLVVSWKFDEPVTRFDTPIYSTGEKAERTDGAVEGSLFTVLLASAVYAVIESGAAACMSARFLLKSWADFAALLPDDFGAAAAAGTDPSPKWKLGADAHQVRDKLLRLADAAWVHLAYHDSQDIYSDSDAKPFKAEIDVALHTLNRPPDDLAALIKDTDFLNGLAVRAGFKDVRLA